MISTITLVGMEQFLLMFFPFPENLLCIPLSKHNFITHSEKKTIKVYLPNIFIIFKNLYIIYRKLKTNLNIISNSTPTYQFVTIENFAITTWRHFIFIMFYGSTTIKMSKRMDLRLVISSIKVASSFNKKKK